MMEPVLSTYASNFKLAAYQSVTAHGGVANADPYAMVLMLMDAAAERIATARGCIERGETARQARLLHSCVNILSELSGSLNMTEGGDLAKNLSNLYEYMIRTLLLANTRSGLDDVTNVARLMDEIRSGWIAIGPQVRNGSRGNGMQQAATG
jgi:flagellar secretion chaperone FliS